MEPATLDDLTGAGLVRSRRRSEASREYRGVFAFRRGHEATLVQALALRKVVEYDSIIDGRRARLRVRLTDMDGGQGMVALQGVGEPWDESDETIAG